MRGELEKEEEENQIGEELARTRKRMFISDKKKTSEIFFLKINILIKTIKLTKEENPGRNSSAKVLKKWL